MPGIRRNFYQVHFRGLPCTFLATASLGRVYFFMLKSTMLTLTAQHAIRALVELAMLHAGETMLGKDLARRANVPANYLSKILWTLGSTGIIEATRGTNGGYRLGRPAESIRLIDVVQPFEKSLPGVSCLLDGTHPCDERAPCAAHQVWSHVRETYKAFLDSTTLAALVKRAEVVHEGVP